MKSFDLHRFWLTLKWDAKTNIRANVRHWLIMLTLFFFAILLPHTCVITEGDKQSSYIHVESISQEEYDQLDKDTQADFWKGNEVVNEDGESVQYYEHRVEMPRIEKWAHRVEKQHAICAIFLFIIVAFYFTFSASLFLNNMTTKQQRITFLSLPASRAEKLLARWVYAVPVWFIMVLTAFIAADLLRYAVQPVIGPYHPGLMITWLIEHAGSAWSHFMENWSLSDAEDREKVIALIVLIICQWVFSHSTYILGSSVFPRFPWLMTTGVICVVSSVMSILMVATGGETLSAFFDDMDQTGTLYAYILSAVLIVLSVVFYVLAIRVFKRVQVINHKYINL